MLAERIPLEEDFYRSELFKMGFVKTKGGKQLYQLNLKELIRIFQIERFKNLKMR